jgi:IS30 family transposase
MRRRTYCQLSAEERDLIAHRKAQGASLRAIAKQLKRDLSTISRELSRNRAPIYNIYLGHQAQKRACLRWVESHRRRRLKTEKLRLLVRRKLKEGWSPEVIAGWLQRNRPKMRISYEAIYQFVYDRAERSQEDLVPYLVRSHKRRRRGHRHTHRSAHIPQRVPISQRPLSVLARHQFGHWEADTVMTRRGVAGLGAIVERKSRFTHLAKLRRRTSRAVSNTIVRSLSRYPAKARRTITYDNGSENVEHMRVNAALGTRSYFCRPYCSWERPTVENTIGLVRRTYPKKTKFDTIPARDIKRLERRLNTKPRKCLNYRSPLEVFSKCCT